jgi:hypothetical protein
MSIETNKTQCEINNITSDTVARIQTYIDESNRNVKKAWEEYERDLASEAQREKDWESRDRIFPCFM